MPACCIQTRHRVVLTKVNMHRYSLTSTAELSPVFKPPTHSLPLTACFQSQNITQITTLATENTSLPTLCGSGGRRWFDADSPRGRPLQWDLAKKTCELWMASPRHDPPQVCSHPAAMRPASWVGHTHRAQAHLPNKIHTRQPSSEGSRNKHLTGNITG